MSILFKAILVILFQRKIASKIYFIKFRNFKLNCDFNLIKIKIKYKHFFNYKDS